MMREGQARWKPAARPPPRRWPSQHVAPLAVPSGGLSSTTVRMCLVWQSGAPRAQAKYANPRARRGDRSPGHYTCRRGMRQRQPASGSKEGPPAKSRGPPTPDRHKPSRARPGLVCIEWRASCRRCVRRRLRERRQFSPSCWAAATQCGIG
eukprot:scaffold624_cov402-Prasinococcus_capsulatus_cf.AAC.9